MDGIAITRTSEKSTAANIVGRFAEGDKERFISRVTEI